jgi:hypothetical protein
MIIRQGSDLPDPCTWVFIFIKFLHSFFSYAFPPCAYDCRVTLLVAVAPLSTDGIDINTWSLSMNSVWGPDAAAVDLSAWDFAGNSPPLSMPSTPTERADRSI